MVKTIPKQVIQGLKSIGDETLERGSDEIKKVVGLSVEKPVDLLPDIGKMSQEERNQLEKSDKQEGDNQAKQIRQELGRNVEGEIKKVRKQKESEEEEKEKQFLKNLEKQRQLETDERNRLAGAQQTPAHRKKKSRGSAFARGKKPTASDMSATGEFNKKKD
jgi:succinate dehydrogenase/fumarate reductase flavoprotein subunit